MSENTENRSGWQAVALPGIIVTAIAAAGIAAALFLTGVIGGDADPGDGAGIGPDMIPGTDAAEWSVETETVTDPDGVTGPVEPTPSGPEGRDDDALTID